MACGADLEAALEGCKDRPSSDPDSLSSRVLFRRRIDRAAADFERLCWLEELAKGMKVNDQIAREGWTGQNCIMCIANAKGQGGSAW
jgi:hypothetical protein